MRLGCGLSSQKGDRYSGFQKCRCFPWYNLYIYILEGSPELLSNVVYEKIRRRYEYSQYHLQISLL